MVNDLVIYLGIFVAAQITRDVVASNMNYSTISNITLDKFNTAFI